MIGIIGAMEIETAFVGGVYAQYKIAEMTFNLCKISNTDVVVAKCGPGKVNAALCTQILINEFKVDSVINMGVAGALNNELNIGDIFIAENSIQTDIDTSAVGDPLGLVSGINVVNFKTDLNIMANLVQAACRLKKSYMVGNISTNDKFIASEQDKKSLYGLFNCDACDMEAGAVGHTCYMYDIPYGVIRCISDKADNSAQMDYPEFLKMACATSKEVLREYVKIIEKN